MVDLCQISQQSVEIYVLDRYSQASLFIALFPLMTLHIGTVHTARNFIFVFHFTTAVKVYLARTIVGDNTRTVSVLIR